MIIITSSGEKKLKLALGFICKAEYTLMSANRMFTWRHHLILHKKLLTIIAV